MKARVSAFLALLALAGGAASNAQGAPAAAPAATAAQTLDQIIAKHLDAIGGEQAIRQVKTISMETDVQVMGNDAPGRVEILNGVGYKTETEFNGSQVIQCYTAKGGWIVNPMAGSSDPQPMPEGQYQSGRDDIYVGGALYDYAARGAKVELTGKGAGGYNVKVISKDGRETTYGIDAKTYLITSATRKTEMQGQDVDLTITYSDYRKTATGYLLPYAMDLDFGGQFQLSIAIKKVELNKPIDPAIFEMPKAASQETAKPQ